MSNSEQESPQPGTSANGADPARSPLDLPAAPKAAPGLPKGVGSAGTALEKQVEKQLTSLAGKPAAAGQKGGPSSTPASAPGASATGSAPAENHWERLAPSSDWVAPATLLALAAGAGLWWWKKRRAKPAAPTDAAQASKPALDVYADWKSFRRRLPRSMRRVLDELQPVIVLGNNASEKELLSQQLSRVADNEQLFPGRVSYRGKGLDLYLGARSLVLVPSDEFLDAPASSENESWRRVLLKVCRVRAPRVVVCLAQAPLDTGNLDEVTLWTSKLRAHVDVIIAVRNEDIELSVALAQAPVSSRGAGLRSTDALFELLGSLGKHEGHEETLSLRLDSLSDQLSPRVEERRESAKRWVIERLRRARKGWPRLLAHPEYDSARLLTLARFFEEFESWSAGLGAGLGELLVHDERKTQRVLGQELCFLPCVERRLIGSVAAFAGPSEERSGRWRPKQSLVHRLVVASAASVLALGMLVAYEVDERAWSDAATAAERYASYEQDNDLDVIRGTEPPGAHEVGVILAYVRGRSLLGFFERNALRCMTVESVQRYVLGLLDQAVEEFGPPEDLIQLIGLLLASEREGCGLQRDPNRQWYAHLAETIGANSRQWSHLTGMSDAEIAAYLELACPKTGLSLGNLELKYGQRTSKRTKDAARHSEEDAASDPSRTAQQGAQAADDGATRNRESNWPRVADVGKLGAALKKLGGRCALTTDERIAMQEAEAIAGTLDNIGEHHGTALSVLKTIRKIDTPGTKLLPGLFDHYESRLQQIEDLGDENETAQLLARDLRPFSVFDDVEACSLEAFNEQLLARDLRPYRDVEAAGLASAEVCSLEALEQQLVTRERGRSPSAGGARSVEGEVCSLTALNRQLLARGLRRFADSSDARQAAPEHCTLDALARQLASDGRPSRFDTARRAARELDSLAALNQQLLASLSGEVPEGEDAIVRLTVAANTIVIDRGKVRASLLGRTLGRLQRDLVDTTIQRELATGSAEVLFFSDDVRARRHYWAPQASIPEGVTVRVEVPWRYTTAGFRRDVLEPIETTYAHLGGYRCDTEKDDQVREELMRDAKEFVGQRLDSYLQAYADTWRQVYESFEVTATTDAALADTLTALSRPTSIQAALLNEVLRQTRLQAADDWPFLGNLAIASKPFDALQGVVSDKAFAEYQGLLQELANVARDAAASDVGWAAATPPAGPASPDASLDAFIADLAGFGRVVAAGLRDPKADVRTRAEAWASAAGLPPASKRPLLQPIDAAYERGRASFESGLARFWVQKSAALRSAVTDRFPFGRSSRVEASIDDLMAWLDPIEGRFVSEVLPIYQLATRCDGPRCPELPPGMRDDVERSLAIQRALFDAKGEPQPLTFRIDPVPFASQHLLPKRSVLRIGEVRHEYFNTAPRTQQVVVPWNEAYVASLSVDLVGERASDELAAQSDTRKSPWAFLRLLTLAVEAVEGRYTWELDAKLLGTGQGKVSVSYDVCRDTGRCGDLLERVFDWP